jgi:uncharacterized lipoprotein NlpE involved in copper resistance
MKKVFLALAVVTVALVACNNEEKKVEETKNDTSATAPVKDTAATAPVKDTAATAPVKDTAK